MFDTATATAIAPLLYPTLIAQLAALVLRRESGAPLSAREREVAVLIAHGLTNRQIAHRLVIAPRTADNHVQHIFDKLGLSSRAQVAAWAAMHGLLSSAAPL
jgi:DNA-binding NarL/FixJ family response regulator